MPQPGGSVRPITLCFVPGLHFLNSICRFQPGVRLTDRGSGTSASFSAAEPAGRVFANFLLLVGELDALLAELLAVAMLELGDLAIEWGFVFHGDWPLRGE